MIGLVLLAHGQLAVESLRSAEMIVGPIAQCQAIAIERHMAPHVSSARLRTALDEVGSDDEGVLILTDMFGGTPTNIAADFLLPDKVDILVGFNLPLLLKAASARQQMSLVELADFLVNYAEKTIMRPATLLK
jgi:PTS system mannose-specific IIA component